jgi:hypothetical protein
VRGARALGLRHAIRFANVAADNDALEAINGNASRGQLGRGKRTYQRVEAAVGDERLALSGFALSVEDERIVAIRAGRRVLPAARRDDDWTRSTGDRVVPAAGVDFRMIEPAVDRVVPRTGEYADRGPGRNGRELTARDVVIPHSRSDRDASG